MISQLYGDDEETPKHDLYIRAASTHLTLR